MLDEFLANTFLRKQVQTDISEYENNITMTMYVLRHRERSIEEDESKTYHSSDKGAMGSLKHSGANHQFSIGKSVCEFFSG